MSDVSEITIADLRKEEAALAEKAKKDTLTLTEANRLARVCSAINRIESVTHRMNWD